MRVLLWILSFVVDMDHAQWDNTVTDGLHFLEHSVLQIPFFLMTLMRYVTPTLDQMFMDSLRWVDQTYIQKHKSDDPHTLRALYYPNLQMYPTAAPKGEGKKPLKQTLTVFAIKYGRKAGISLAVLALSYVPYIGRFVLPAASFYTFQNAVGPQPALAIFAVSLTMPRRYLVTFLQSYFSSRTLMRELVSCCAIYRIVRSNLGYSWSRTLRASGIPRSRRRYGSKTVPVSYSALGLDSTFLSRYLYLESSYMGWLRLRPLI